ncbi:MAG: carboxypeptidase-like regulatory domain-containing protein, partial [Campylobacterota bacterium]|nr:carboxypeptidase-like regulatory domain-containing protein [Campylobacterota bacterium]
PVGQSGLLAVDESENTGIIHGVVLTSDKSLPIANARVFVKGTSIDAKTDELGNFYVEVPADTKLNISIVHSEYSAQTIADLEVAKDDTINTEVKLTPASMELEEFIVLAPKVEGSISSIMNEEKKTNAIANIIGSDQMSKKGDSDAASALKRVTGVTLVDGKSIYVRGLGDRYSNTEMNSLPLPSPDPLKRSVPLDIFPSGVIKSMKVQKSGTADIPASFGGGYVDIRTKDSSKEDYVKLSIGIRGNSNTGKETVAYKGSQSDWTGHDDGYRAINSQILAESQVVPGEKVKDFVTEIPGLREGYTKEELSKFTQDFANTRSYNVTKEKLPFGGSGSLEGAVNFEPIDKHKITLFGNYRYKQEHKSREETIAKYDMDITTGSLLENPDQEGKALKSYSEYSQAGIFNIGYNYADIFKVKYTKLYSHTGTSVTKLTEGEFGSNQGELYSFYDLQWEERTLDVDQISGNFDYSIFNNEANFRFGYEDATAKLYQPNNYRYYYLLDEGAIDNQPYMSDQESNHVATRQESEDTQNAFYLKNKFHFDLLSSDDFIDIGFSNSKKERTSTQLKYFFKYYNTTTTPSNRYTDDVDTIYSTYVTPDINYNDRNLRLHTLSRAQDNFDASVEQQNYYISAFFKPLESLELLVGARGADVTQTVYQYSLENQIVKVTPNELKLDEIYPSMSMKYHLNKSNIVDFAYSKTYVLPDLRESSEGVFVHPYDIADIRGNPDLVYTNIDSLDLKYSHYFSDTENITTGIYYKNLDKPIEDVMLPSSSLPIYSFDNTDKAIIMGFEIDGRKDLSFLYSKLKNYFISGNFSYTDSEVTLTKEQESLYTSNHRELQGLSPFVVNLALSYEDKERSATLSYNKMSERIRKIGMIEYESGQPLYFPDYYEDPAAVLDFVWIHKIAYGLSYKIKVGNILDEETVWYQGDKNHVTNSFKKGINYSLSMSYKY